MNPNSNTNNTNLDGLDRFLRTPEVLRISGLSRVTLWRLERLGKFPLRRKLSVNSVGWLESEVFLWLEKKRQEVSNAAL